MPKIEAGSTGFFKYDGLPIQRGAYEPVVNKDKSKFGIRKTSVSAMEGDFLSQLQPPGNYTDSTDTPFATVQEILTAIEAFFFQLGAAKVIADGEVDQRADLPLTIGDPQVGAIFIVTQDTFVLGVWNQYPAGQYIKNTDTGSLSDWKRLGFKTKFTTGEFAVVDSTDQSKQKKDDVSNITTGTTRTFSWPDKNGLVNLVAPNVVQVTSLADFPTPISNFIPFADNTIYIIHGEVVIGANGLDWGTSRSVKILGIFSSTDRIVSTKTGDFIIGTTANPSFDTITIINNVCTDFLVITGGGTQIISFNATIFIGTGNLGTLDSFAVLIFQEWQNRDFTGGLLFTGASLALLIRATQFVNCSGNLIDLGTATFNFFEIDSMVAAVPIASIAINVATDGDNINAGGEGIITSTNIDITGGGLATVGYNPLDLAWNVYGNSESIITSDRITPTGFAFYQDEETSPATQGLTTTPQKMQIDGAGSESDSSFLPKSIRGIGELWDVVNDKITPITIGDSYDVGIDIEVLAKGGGVSQIIVTVDIGGAAGITIPIITADSFVGKTPPFTKRINLLMFTKATFLTNGGQIFLATDTGTATIGERQITISRNSSGAS